MRSVPYQKPRFAKVKGARKSKFSTTDLYRLTMVSNPWGLSNEAWSYDALGNRKTDKQRGGSNPWQANANNQITKSYTENNTPITPVWDENGSLIEHQTSDPAPELNQSYQYDVQNRLIEVRAKDGQRIARYQYDPFGRRIAKTTGEGTTYFLYTDDGLIAEASANGTVTTEYGWKPGSTWSSDPLTLTTTRTGSPDKETFAYQNDHLGTPQKIIDRQGQVVWEAQAMAFGETKVQANATITNNLRFPGQYYDAETKTHYNFFRDYNPATGAYRQADPIGLAGGMNLYAYVGRNPVIYSDPTGEIAPAVVPYALALITGALIASWAKPMAPRDEVSSGIPGIGDFPSHGGPMAWPDPVEARRSGKESADDCPSYALGSPKPPSKKDCDQWAIDVLIKQFGSPKPGFDYRDHLAFSSLKKYCQRHRGWWN